ncbi:MAG: sigma-70 family RNA polymerase sigma factor [Microthrixaceae bacterium]
MHIESGQRSSVEALFRDEFQRLVRSLALVDGVEQATDAVQEAFIQADRKWRRVGSLEDPTRWVRRVALNRLLNGRRDSRRRTEILAAVRPVDETGLDPLDLDLMDGIRELPRQQRLAVCLHYLGGYSLAEVAEDLDLAPGTVKSHLHDARKALRRTLVVADDV